MKRRTFLAGIIGAGVASQLPLPPMPPPPEFVAGVDWAAPEVVSISRVLPINLWSELDAALKESCDTVIRQQYEDESFLKSFLLAKENESL